MMTAGPKYIQNHIRTVFEDCEHGSEMQISTVILNLLEVAWVLCVDRSDSRNNGEWKRAVGLCGPSLC